MRVMTSAVVLALLPFNCPTFEPVTKCRIDKADDNFARVITDYNISSPDRCPYKIAVGRTASQAFTARLTGDGINVIALYSAVTSQVYIGVTNNAAYPFSVHSFQGSPPQALPSVEYVAGQGSLSTDPGGKDTGRLSVTLQYGGSTLGFADLTFGYAVYPTIRTTSPVPPGSVPIESAVVNARAPVTYKWYQNNALLPQTSASFTKSLLEGTYTFKVVARDADGDTGYVSKTINVTTNCGSVCPK